jgi:serine/threonine-protein kinase
MAPFDFVLAGRYRLIAPLGEGGMASVYRARDLRLNREVAVKVLRDELTRDAHFLARFQREAQVVASLSHPNIVPVYDVGEEQGSHFIVMEYVRGRTLKETLSAMGPLPPERAIPVLQSILDALGYAHRQGLIHRDVKPQNILIAPDGSARLADFGIAHLTDGSTTRTAAILGSAHYLSPEQARGEEATIRSDVYACGVVLFEMLEGRPPFDGANALAIASQHVHGAIPVLSDRHGERLPKLEEAVARALAKEPESRFADAAEFSAALAPALGADAMARIEPLDMERTQRLELPSSASTPTATHDELRLRRSTRKTASLAALFAAGVAVAAYFASQGIAGRSLPSYPSAPYALLPAVVAAYLFLSWLNNRSWSYRMDGNAAVVQWGLIGHHRLGVPVRFITSLELKQSPIDRLLGVGTVEVCARDRHGNERRLVMEDLPHPGRTYEELMRFVGRAAHLSFDEPDETEAFS